MTMPLRLWAGVAGVMLASVLSVAASIAINIALLASSDVASASRWLIRRIDRATRRA